MIKSRSDSGFGRERNAPRPRVVNVSAFSRANHRERVVATKTGEFDSVRKER
jgi:hypothetical protein